MVQVLLQVLAIQAWWPEFKTLTWWKERTDSHKFSPDLSVCLTNCGTHTNTIRKHNKKNAIGLE